MTFHPAVVRRHVSGPLWILCRECPRTGLLCTKARRFKVTVPEGEGDSQNPARVPCTQTLSTYGKPELYITPGIVFAVGESGRLYWRINKVV